jgi:hypothetical protein
MINGIDFVVYGRDTDEWGVVSRVAEDIIALGYAVNVVEAKGGGAGSLLHNTTFYNAPPEYLDKFITEKNKTVLFTAFYTEHDVQQYIEQINKTDIVIANTIWMCDTLLHSGVSTRVEVAPFFLPQPTRTHGSLSGIPKKDYVFYTLATENDTANTMGILNAYLTAFTSDDNVYLVLNETYAPSKAKDNLSARISMEINNFGKKSAKVILHNTERMRERDALALFTRGNCFVNVGGGKRFGTTTLHALSYQNNIISTSYGVMSEIVPQEYLLTASLKITPSIHNGVITTTQVVTPEYDTLPDIMRRVRGCAVHYKGIGAKTLMDLVNRVLYNYDIEEVLRLREERERETKAQAQEQALQAQASALTEANTLSGIVEESTRMSALRLGMVSGYKPLTEDVRTIVLGVTTYNRGDYIRTFMETFAETYNPAYRWVVLVNDDGSEDGTVDFLSTHPPLPNVTLRLLQTRQRGVHFATNNILTHAMQTDFDYGFKCDDDMVFLRKGWEELYINASLASGYEHLCLFSKAWAKRSRNKCQYKGDNLQSYVKVGDAQGVLWTFTKRLVDTIGYFDTVNMGKRGGGHRDYSERACRAGFNSGDSFWDARDSQDYVRLHVEDYVMTPGYAAEMRKAVSQKPFKDKVRGIAGRVYVPRPESVLNYYFDKVYLVNLKRQPDKLERMDSVLRRHRIDYELFEAVDGRESEEAQRIYNYQRSNNESRGIYNPGVIGCTLSHLTLYRKIKENGYRRTLILEDDLLFATDFERRVEELVSLPDWKLLYLGASDWNFYHNYPAFRSEHKNTPYYRGYGVDSTFSYGIDSSIIDDILDMYTTEHQFGLPCDTKLHDIQRRHTALVMYPNLMIADVTSSDLREGRDMTEHSVKMGWDKSLYDN